MTPPTLMQVGTVVRPLALYKFKRVERERMSKNPFLKHMTPRTKSGTPVKLEKPEEMKTDDTPESKHDFLN